MNLSVRVVKNPNPSNTPRIRQGKLLETKLSNSNKLLFVISFEKEGIRLVDSEEWDVEEIL